MNFLFGISLTASFFAGVLALFAPCCITFLFPAYLGTIFKEGRKVIFYTLVFALGLSFILIPVALGFRFFVFFFDSYHQWIYYLGSVILIFMGMVTIKPIFQIPKFFHFRTDLSGKINTGSVFGLGVISGLTSSCCAPVLFAAVTLTTLSPTLFQATAVAAAYVLGIVFPLFILSIFYKDITSKVSGENRKKLNRIFTILGAAIFILSGVIIGILTYFNKIQMYQTEGYSRSVRLFVSQFGRFFQNPVVDVIVFLTIVFIFYKVLQKHGDGWHKKKHRGVTEKRTAFKKRKKAASQT